ncbi:MAG: type II secretion system protein GspD, partial [Sphingomonadaceae bacterium]
RPTIIRSAADAQALAARRYGYVRNQQWAQRQDREPSIDELVRDYLGTGAPVAPASAAKSQAKPEVVVPQMRESQQRIYTAPVPPSDAKK